MHIVFRFDGHAASRCDLVSIAEEGIRLRLDISHIDGCADRRTAGAGRRGDGVLHFLDFMRRRERDILRAILAVAGLPVDLHARIRVCLRDRGEVHHIRRTRKAGIRAARRLQGQIENVFAVLGIQRNLAFGIQLGRLACIGFCVFREIHHGESQSCTAARRADGCAAVAAMKFRRIRRRDGDPICISRACGSELGIVFRIRFGLRIQHIHADRAIDGRGACKAARDGRIGDVCRMICCDADILPRDLRTAIDMRLRIRAHRDGRVCQPDASRTTAADAAGTGTLLEGGKRLYIRIARGGDIRRLAHMSVCRMRDKSFRSRARDTRRTADAKTCRRCRRVAGILRLYSEAFSANARVVAYIGRSLLLHHFDRRGEAPGCRPAHSPIAAGRCELRRILRRHGDGTRLYELGFACIRDIFVLLISDIRFRIGRNHMESGCPGAGKCIPRRDRRRNGCQILFRLGIHADRRRLRELRTVFNGRIGMPLVRLYVCRRADARAAQVDPKAASQTEETRCILRFYVNALISCLIVSLADRCIGLLGNDIHRDRAGTGEFRRACRKAHRDGLRRTITIAVLRRPIVCIVRLDRDAVCLDGLFFLCIARERRLDVRVIHHNCDRRADGRIRDRTRTDTKRRIAVISGIDRKGPCLHSFAAIHMGIRRRMDPVSARREGRRRLIRQCAGRDDRCNLARFIRSDGELARLFSFRCPSHFTVFQICLRIAFDEVHTDGCADRGRARGNRHCPCVRVDFSLVLRFDGGGFLRLHRTVLHMCIRLVIHPVQADLPCTGEALRRTAAARRDVQDHRIILRTDGEGLVDVFPVLVFFFIAAQGERRPIHIGFVVRRDGVVHEASRKRRSGLGMKIGSDGCRRRADRTVIQTIHTERIGRDRGRSPTVLFRHDRLRGIDDTVHGHIRCGCQTTLRLSHVILHRAVLTCYPPYMTIRFLREERCIFIGIIHIIDKIFQLDAVFIAVFDRMETGAASLVLHIRLLIVIGDRTRNRGCDDLARVLRGDIDIVIRRDIPRDRGFRITVDVIVRDGRTDPCAAADADRARRLNGLREVFRGDRDILRRDRRVSDARLRCIIETVHAHRCIDRNGLRRAACRGHRDIERACLRIDICRSLRRDHRAVIDIGLCVILLMHGERRAADTCLGCAFHRPAISIENILEGQLFVFIFISRFPEIQRSCAQIRLDRTCQIHCRDVRLARDIHVASGIDCRRRRLRVIFLSNIRFGVVVIVHDGDGRRAIHVVAISRRLRPAVHQIGKDGIRIDRVKEDIQKLIHGIAALPARLPGDDRLRMDGRISAGLRVATDESSRVISLFQIRDRRRDGIVLLRGLILGRCVILVRTNNRMAARERQRIDRERLCARRVTCIPARIDAAHLPRHRRRRIIVTEKKRCRRIRSHLVPWFLLLRRLVRFIEVKVLCRLACLIFFGKCFFQFREKFSHACLDRICRRLERRIPADARCRHRIRRIDAAVFRERILRFDRHIALRVDRARHIRARFRIRDPETDREPQRLPAVRRTRAQRADGFRTDIHIALTCQRRLLSYFCRDVARKLCPGEIQRQPAHRHCAEIYQAHLDRIRAFRGERRILRGSDRAVIHIDVRLHVADAHVKPDANKIHIERRDIRLCV